MKALDRLKELQGDVAQAIAEAEAEETGATEPVAAYLPSVSGVVVDPETGNIDLKITLHPQESPVSPPPVEVPPVEPPIAEREAPPVGAEATSTTVVAPDEDAPQPGFEPAA